MKNSISKVKDSVNQFGFISIGFMFGFAVAILTGETSGPVFTGVVVGSAAGLISIFVDFLIQPEQIFGFWSTKVLAWLKKDRNLFRFMAKPLGGCLYCMNVWLTLVVFIWSKPYTGFSWPVFLAVVSVSHVVLALTERKVNS
jgi:hypothetical protein